MPDPNLQVSLLKPEEAEQYMRIRHEVFRPTVNQLLYSRGEPSEKTLSRVTDDIRDGILNKGIIFLKCVDTKTGEMVAGARWRYVKPQQEGAKERTWEEVDAGFSIPEPFDESDPELFESVFKDMNANKREVLGNRPYYVLDTLVTLQKHERRGAGSMLVRWGCEKADEAGVEAFLEASPMGAPMYARHGFRPVKEVEWDLRKWGGMEHFRLIVSLWSTLYLLCRMWLMLFVGHAEASQRGNFPINDILGLNERLWMCYNILVTAILVCCQLTFRSRCTRRGYPSIFTVPGDQGLLSQVGNITISKISIVTSSSDITYRFLRAVPC
jgi:GNAT superfamily N-acetyltransferase